MENLIPKKTLYLPAVLLFQLLWHGITTAGDTISSTAAAPHHSSTSFVSSSGNIRATRQWNIYFAPKFKSYGETGKLSNYWQPAWEALEKAGKKMGVTAHLVASPIRVSTDEEYVEPQIRLIAGLLSGKKVDGLIIAPFNSDRLAPVVEKIVATGIPVIAMDTPVNSEKVLTYIAFDNFAAGSAMGEWIVDRLGGHGSVLILKGPPNQQNAIDRLTGFLAGLHKGDIDVLSALPADWAIAPAKTIVNSWLQEFPKIDAILAANDNMAIGACEAVCTAHRKIIITGFDATREAFSKISEGKIAATIDQSPDRQAILAIELMVRHLETGERFPRNVFLAQMPIITKDRLDSLSYADK